LIQDSKQEISIAKSVELDEVVDEKFGENTTLENENIDVEDIVKCSLEFRGSSINTYSDKYEPKSRDVTINTYNEVEFDTMKPVGHKQLFLNVDKKVDSKKSMKATGDAYFEPIKF
jgi:hypothetical protein